MATAVVLESADTGIQRTFNALPGQPIIVGRESTSKPQPLSDSEARYRSAVMSSRHAEISVGLSADQVFLVDTASRHGTTINGQKLPAHVAKALLPGDLLKFGVRVDKSPGEFYEGVAVFFRGAERKQEQEQEEMVQHIQQSRSSFSVPGDEDESEIEFDFPQDLSKSHTPGKESDADERILSDDVASISGQVSPPQDDVDDGDNTDDASHWTCFNDDASARRLSPEFDDEIYQPKPGFRIDMVTGRETYAQPSINPDSETTEDTNPQPDRRFDVAPNGVPTFTKNDVALAKAKFAANKINAKILGQQDYELGMTKMVLDWYNHEHAANNEELHQLRATVVQLEGQLAGKKRKAEDADQQADPKRQAVAVDKSDADGPVRRVARAKRLPRVTLGRALGVVALSATAALFCEWGVC